MSARSGRVAARPAIRPESRGFVLLLGVLAALPALAIDISAPVLALLPQALGTGRTVATLTLTTFMAGFAGGQLGGGIVSDRRGRRPVLLPGLALFVLASVLAALAPDGATMLLARLLQGLGAGACAVIAFATVQDCFEGDVARRKRSYVAVVFAAVPMLAPALGALILALAGWRAVHAALAIGGIGLLAICWLWLAETRPPGRRARRGDAAPRLLGDRRFAAYALANALSYGAIFAYIAGAPMVVVGEMGFAPRSLALLFAATAAALTAGAWLNGRLARRGVRAAPMVVASLVAAAAAALCLLAVLLRRDVSIAAALPMLLAILFARGIAAPNLQHLAIERRREQAGAASAAVGVSQLGAGALASAVVAALVPHAGAAAVALPMATLAALAFLVWIAIPPARAVPLAG